MIDSLLKKLNTMYSLNEVSKQNLDISKMHFCVTQYYAKNLGNVSIMQGKTTNGLMKMDILIINPFEKDIPLFSYDRVKTLLKDNLYCELFETRVDNDKVPEFIKDLGKLNKYNIKLKPNWYDDILYKESINSKTSKLHSKYLDESSNKFFNAYLKWSIQARNCDRYLKKAKAKEYTENLLQKGGPSTDLFIKEKGKEFTEKLFREVLFGTSVD